MNRVGGLFAVGLSFIWQSLRMIRLPPGGLVVLIGPSGSGKSTWAAENIGEQFVTSSDQLRAQVGQHVNDQRAGTDAFDVLDLIVERRLKRGLLTVVDTLGSDQVRRRSWIEVAKSRNRTCHAIVFDTSAAECRKRNKARAHPVPAKVLSAQIERHAELAGELHQDGFDTIDTADQARVVPLPFLGSPQAYQRQKDDPVSMTFGLQIPRFDFGDDTNSIPGQLANIASNAEDAGFSSIWVMDHFQQIPQVGRAWEPMLESYTTLGFLAAHTSRVTLGTLVTGITYRNIAHLGKIVATLDVLSGGRSACGIGAAWFEQEHTDYGWSFPAISERYDLLEDALELLPMLWGPGQPEFNGRAVSVPKAVCYPRPIQEHIPMLVGGSGETRTLRLVARHADACNLFGEADAVRHKVAVLQRHCETEGRDLSDITITQLASVLVGSDEADLQSRLTALAPVGVTEIDVAQRFNGATVDDHIGRFRELADAGVSQAIVSFPDIASTDVVERFAPIIEAFR